MVPRGTSTVGATVCQPEHAEATAFVHVPLLACAVAVAMALTWLLPPGAVAVDVAIGTGPAASTLFVVAAPGEGNSLTIARDASGFTVDENGAATMTPGAGCGPGPGPNAATCPGAGVSRLSISLGDGDDAVTVAAPTNAVILGGPGDDQLQGGTGQDVFEGDEGTDGVSYGPRVAPITTSKDGVANDGEANEGDNIGSDVERITGGSANDSIGGGPDADILDGGPGDDTLSGGPGADQLLGGPGRDAVAYTSPADVKVWLETGIGGSAQPGDSDRIADVEDVAGGDERDTVTGSSADNALGGGRGEDYLDGRRGVDRVDGGGNADVVVARDGAPDEPVSCGPGQDLAIVDRADRVARTGPNRCERIDDGTDTRPRPGWVYVHPQRCATPAQLGLTAMHRRVPLRYSVLLASGYRQRAAPTLDASDCAIRVRATPGQGRTTSADVSGTAVTVGQSSGRRVTTTLTVLRPRCAGRRRSPNALPPEARLRVATDRRRGRWRVKGRHSIAAAVGTDWVTLEGCSRTVTVVRRGRVQVFDRVKRRTVTVRAGHRYVAREGR
jgi:Ca2+-binding RTX toxin-like protein